jgi:hypothetical protein
MGVDQKDLHNPKRQRGINLRVCVGKDPSLTLRVVMSTATSPRLPNQRGNTYHPMDMLASMAF